MADSTEPGSEPMRQEVPSTLQASQVQQTARDARAQKRDATREAQNKAIRTANAIILSAHADKAQALAAKSIKEMQGEVEGERVPPSPEEKSKAFVAAMEQIGTPALVPEVLEDPSYLEPVAEQQLTNPSRGGSVSQPSSQGGGPAGNRAPAQELREGTGQPTGRAELQRAPADQRGWPAHQQSEGVQSVISFNGAQPSAAGRVDILAVGTRLANAAPRTVPGSAATFYSVNSGSDFQFYGNPAADPQVFNNPVYNTLALANVQPQGVPENQARRDDQIFTEQLAMAYGDYVRQCALHYPFDEPLTLRQFKEAHFDIHERRARDEGAHIGRGFLPASAPAMMHEAGRSSMSAPPPPPPVDAAARGPTIQHGPSHTATPVQDNRSSMGPPVRVAMAGLPAASANPAGWPRQQQSTFIGMQEPDERRSQRPFTAMSNQSYSSPRVYRIADVDKFPAFTPLPGIIWTAKYHDEVVSWLAPHEKAIREDHEQQLLILKASFRGAQAQGFSLLKLYEREFLSMCPNAEPFLAETLQGRHVLGSTSNLVQKSSEFIRDYRAQLRLKAPNTESPLQQGAGLAARFPKGPIQVIYAWLYIVDAEYGIPLPSELKLWTAGLVQGKPSIMNPQVPVDETPRVFVERVITAYEMFSRFNVNNAVADVLASHSPLRVTQAGVNPSLRQFIITAHLSEDIQGMTPGQQAGSVVTMLQRAHDFYVGEHTRMDIMPTSTPLLALMEAQPVLSNPADRFQRRIPDRPTVSAHVAEAAIDTVPQQRVQPASEDDHSSISGEEFDREVTSAATVPVPRGSPLEAMHPRGGGFRGSQQYSGTGRPGPPRDRMGGDPRANTRYPAPPAQQSPNPKLALGYRELSNRRTECAFCMTLGGDHSTNNCPHKSLFDAAIAKVRNDPVVQAQIAQTSQVQRAPEGPPPAYARTRATMAADYAPPSRTVQELPYQGQASTPHHSAAAGLEHSSFEEDMYDNESDSYDAHACTGGTTWSTTAHVDVHSCMSEVQTQLSRPPTLPQPIIITDPCFTEWKPHLTAAHPYGSSPPWWAITPP